MDSSHQPTSIWVSIQLISLASRDISNLRQKDHLCLVSIQLISLASRDLIEKRYEKITIQFPFS